MAENAEFYFHPRPVAPDEKAAKVLTPEARGAIAELAG